jgi:hypothetical protein
MSHLPFSPCSSLSSSSPRQRRWQLASSLILILFLLAGLLTNLTSALPVQAAPGSKQPLTGSTKPPAPPVSHMTVSQFLKEGQREKAYHGPLIRPSKALTVPLSPKANQLT